MKQPTPFSGMVAAATLASVLTACGGSGDSGLGVIEIRSLSNRADMISDGNAYIEIVPPKGSPPGACLLYTSPSPRDLSTSRMPSSA